MTQRPVRILVVEDEIMIGMCLELELRRAGYTVCQRVVSGEEAVAWVNRDPPDLILMDIRLSGRMDGIEAAQQILTSHAIPIIFMTGYPDRDLMERANSLNPAGYLNKPVEIHEIVSIIKMLRFED